MIDRSLEQNETVLGHRKAWPFFKKKFQRAILQIFKFFPIERGFFAMDRETAPDPGLDPKNTAPDPASDCR